MLNITKLRRIAAIAVISAFAAGAATSAVAETTWEKEHPRRDQVNDRLAN